MNNRETTLTKRATLKKCENNVAIVCCPIKHLVVSQAERETVTSQNCLLSVVSAFVEYFQQNLV